MSELTVSVKLEGAGAAKTEIDALNGSVNNTASSGKNASEALGKGTAAMDQYGMSAKATSAALRGVPAQFTDIATSLAAGQNPLQVFMQQGGQLKDMFGGAGNAAKALGSYVLGLVTPYTLAAGAVGVLAVAYAQGSQEVEQFQRTLILTGNAAAKTSNDLMDSSRLLAEASGTTQGKAAKTMNALLDSGQVGAGAFNTVAQAAIHMEEMSVQSIEETVKVFAKIGGDPVKAIDALDEKYHFLTVSVYEQIRALVAEGKADEAAELAQISYAKAMDDRMESLKSQLGTLETVWLNLKKVAKGTWDAMLGIGREDTLLEQLNKANEDVKNGGTFFGGEAEARNRQAVLVAAVEAQLRLNDAKKTENEITKEGIAAVREKYEASGKKTRGGGKIEDPELAALIAYSDTMTRIRKELDAEMKGFEASRKEELKAALADEARLQSLVGGTDYGKQLKNEDTRAFAESMLWSGKLDQQPFDEIIANLDKVKDKGEDTFKSLQQSIEGWGKDAAKAIVDFAMTGKTSFSDMAQSIIADMMTMVAQQNITGPLATAFGGWAKGLFSSEANALGGVYAAPGLSAYSSQVVNRPTLFPFARGVGLMGEAGPEAIMPLQRDASGRLGVAGGGSNVNVTVINQGAADGYQATTRTRKNESGIDIELLVSRAVQSDMRRNGPITQGFGAMFGVSRAVG